VRSVAREIEADVSRLVTVNVTFLTVSISAVTLVMLQNVKLLLLSQLLVLRTAAIRIKVRTQSDTLLSVRT
jgi:hypothetical protein